jgi:hypothetical protein
MDYLKIRNKIGIIIFSFVMLVSLSDSYVMHAYSHGGKMHAEVAFTALQAVQKATQLYDRLVTSEKLPPAWEIGLKTIKISTRNNGSMLEYVVQFETTQENPNSVYFFFNQEGAYSGSNFTGK